MGRREGGMDMVGLPWGVSWSVPIGELFAFKTLTGDVAWEAFLSSAATGRS